MPRPSAITRTRGPSSAPYTTAPSVRSEVIARQTPVFGSKSAGLDSLAQSLEGFGEGFNNAVQTVMQTDFTLQRAQIERENEQQQLEAKEIAARGGELTPEQANDWDYVTPYNKVKAIQAAAEDTADFQSNVLSKLSLADDPQRALMEYMNGKLKGIQNKQFAGFYSTSMLEGNLDAIAKHRADLFAAKQEELKQSWVTGLGFKLQTGQITSVDQLNGEVATMEGLYGPAKATEGRIFAMRQILNLASINDKGSGLLDNVVSLLSQPQQPSPANPQGLSWASRFPDGFNSWWEEAKKQTDVQFQQNLDDTVFGIKQSLASGKIEDAATALATAASTFGDQPELRELDLTIRKEFAQGYNRTAATQGLLNWTTADGAANVEDVNKYGADVLAQVAQDGGPLAVADRIIAWGRMPPSYAQQMNGNLTQTNNPATVAATAEFLLPIYKQAPALVAGALDKDASFVLNFVDSEHKLGNTNTLEAASRALGALNYVRENNINPNEVKLWDSSKQGAEQKFRDNLVSQVQDMFPTTGGVLGFFGNKVTVPDAIINNTVIPAIREKTIWYDQTGLGHDEAVKRATQDVLTGMGTRFIPLPNRYGETVLTEDTSPDFAKGEAVLKWRDDQLTGYSPLSVFRKESEQFPFLTGGEPLGLVFGKDAMIDGTADVIGPDGYELVLEAGQEITTNEIVGYRTITGKGMSQRVPVYQPRTTVLPDDPRTAKLMLEELFHGTGFTAKAFGPTGFQVQYTPLPQKLNDLKTLARQNDLNRAIEREDAGRVSFIERFREKFRAAMANNSGRDFLYQPWTDKEIKMLFTDDQGKFHWFEVRDPNDPKVQEQLGVNDTLQTEGRKLVTNFQDRGLLPQSIGVTKPLPAFNTPDGVFDYIHSEIMNNQLKNGNYPAEASNTPTDEKYISMRYDFLKLNEGKRYTVYRDTKGLPTVGLGFNLAAPATRQAFNKLGLDLHAIEQGKERMTDSQIQAVFEELITQAEAIVSSRIKAPLNTYQRLALVSLAYNNPKLIGPHLTAAINEGRWDDAVKEIAEKSNAGGSFGIQVRREREAAYLSRGVADSYLSDIIRQTS